MLNCSGNTPKKCSHSNVVQSALSYLILKQFDAVGLTLFNDHLIEKIPPRSKPSHFQHIVHGLELFEPSGNTLISQVIGEITEELPIRSMVLLVSDLFTSEDDLYEKLKLICSRGLEVIVFHVLHSDEIHFPFEGDIVFESLEEDPDVSLDPADIRESYQNIIQGIIQSYQKNMPSLGVDYVFMETATPLDQALNYYLLRRKSLHKT